MSKKFTSIMVSTLALLMMFTLSVSAQPLNKGFDKKQSRTSALSSFAQKRELMKKYPAIRPVESLAKTVTPFRTKAHRLFPAKKDVLQALKAETGVEIGGNLIYWSDMDDDNTDQAGLYTIPVSSSVTMSDFTGVVNDEELLNVNSGVVANGKYYYSYLYSYSGSYYNLRNVVNLSTGQWEVADDVQEDFSNAPTGDMCYVEADGKAYGVFYNAEATGLVFGSIDLESWTVTAINTTDYTNGFRVLTDDADGQLWGITNDGDLVKVDKNTGATTMIGSTGLTPYYIQSGCIDKANNVLYWAVQSKSDTPGLYTVNMETGAATMFANWGDLEILSLYCASAPAPAGDGKQPAEAENLQVIADNSTFTSAEVTFTIPTLAADGETALEGEIQYAVSVNDEVAKSGSAAPGATVNVTVEGLSKGYNTFSVKLSNSHGDSKEAKTRLWIGLDAPNAPKSASLAIDEAALATVTWTAPTTTVHGGYMDAANLTYTITRYPDEKVVAEGVTATTFQDQLDPEQLAVWSYGIVAVNGEEKSEEAVTNSAQSGQYIIPPYLETFTTEDGFALYTTTGTGGKWTYYAGLGCVRVGYGSGGADNDTWLLSPQVKLLPGYEYTFSFDAANYLTSWYAHTIAAAFGEGDDPTVWTPWLESTQLESDDFVTYSTSLQVEQETLYRFGIHDVTLYDDAFYAYFDNIRIDVQSLAAPDSVTQLKVTTANGALSGTADFVNPTKAINGDALTELTKIEVAVDDVLATTVDAAAVGASMSVPFEVTASGFHKITVTPYSAAGVGRPNSITVFIGIDTPKAPEASITDNGDDTATLHIVAPGNEGKNGGFVDVSALTFKIYSITDDGYLGDLVATTTDTEFALPASNLDKGDMGFLQYAVSANNASGESSFAVPSIIVGEPETTPFVETIESGLEHWWWYSREGNVSPAFGDFNSEGIGRCIVIQASEAGALDWNTGKITLKGNVNPHFIFDYYAYVGDDAKLIVQVDREQKGEAPVVLETVDYKTLTGEDGWRTLNIDLSDFVSDRYVIITTRFEANEATSMALDFWRVMDIYQNDLMVEATGPKNIKVNESGNIVATVTNLGANEAAAADYKVSLYNNDELVETKDGEVDLPGYYAGKTDVTFTLTPTVFDGDYNLKVVVDMVGDENPDNNTAELTVPVKQNNVETVGDLQAVAGEWPEVQLTWTNPIDPNAQPEGQLVTEDFEDTDIFVAWSHGGITADVHTGAFGEWTVYDPTGADVYFSSGWTQPNGGDPSAFQVFNLPDADNYGLDITDENSVASYGANSGDQYLMCWNNVGSAGATDSWLISPELDGSEQEISFFVNEITAQYGNETYEVLYSTTDKDPASFTKVAEGEVTAVEWTEVKVELPEGAKYFAIRCTSNDIFGFRVDDVTFTAAASSKTLARAKAAAKVVKGFNVYRDGEKVAFVEGAENTSYTDMVDTDGTHVYNVTIVLEGDIESPLSNTVSVVTGIKEMTVTASFGDADVTVYGTNGALITRGKGALNTLKPGVYVVRNNETGEVKSVTKK